jgi:hypothetical protein
LKNKCQIMGTLNTGMKGIQTNQARLLIGKILFKMRLEDWKDLKALISDLVPQDAKVLILGCGNACKHFNLSVFRTNV